MSFCTFLTYKYKTVALAASYLSTGVLRLRYPSPPHAPQAHLRANVNHQEYIVILETSYLISKNIAVAKWFMVLHEWRPYIVYFLFDF